MISISFYKNNGYDIKMCICGLQFFIKRNSDHRVYYNSYIYSYVLC